MNLQRGFHRVFVILWVLYAAAIILYPLYLDNEEMEAAARLSSPAGYADCVDAYRKSYPDKVTPGGFSHFPSPEETCTARSKDAFKNVGLGMTWKKSWNNVGWNLIWQVLLVLLIPPMIVYGLIWSLVKTVLWAARGFRQPTS